jgi:hypothetical protein
MATNNMMPSIEVLFKYYIDNKDEDFIKETMKMMPNKFMEADAAS